MIAMLQDLTTEEFQKVTQPFCDINGEITWDGGGSSMEVFDNGDTRLYFDPRDDFMCYQIQFMLGWIEICRAVKPDGTQHCYVCYIDGYKLPWSGTNPVVSWA